MGTRSSIAIKNADGTIESIYARWDGYLEGNGVILLENYTTEEKVRQLLALGNVSSLDNDIGEKHDFNQSVKGWTEFYSRDRGKAEQEAIRSSNEEAWIRAGGQEYNYLFLSTEKRWVVEFGDLEGEFIDLAKAIGQEAKKRSTIDFLRP